MNGTLFLKGDYGTDRDELWALLEPIPTLNQWGMIILALGLGLLALVIRKRKYGL